MYFENNLTSLINLLKCVQEFKIPYFVFSSSCTVYGNPDQIPVTEQTPPKPAESPMAIPSKWVNRSLMNLPKAAVHNAYCYAILTRLALILLYTLVKCLLGRPQNLVPAITQTAIGKLPKMTVHGNDYDTRDGSCIRDFIHVCDIAHAHTLAIRYLEQIKVIRFVKCLILAQATG